MSLIDRPFAATFDFGRPLAAPVRTSTGAVVQVAADIARFDHDEAGNRRGLLVEPGPELGQHDRLVPNDTGWAIPGAATVLLEWEEDGVIRRRAHYTSDAEAAVAAVLRTSGHLRKVGALPGFLANLAAPGEAGFVRYASLTWSLGSAIAIDPDTLLGDSSGRAFLESA